jgi:hypothetical protein
MLRRELLQVGFLGALGVPMTAAFAPQAAQAARAAQAVAGIPARAKRVILVWLPGGPPQMQLWDLKPDSPSQCRGTATPIETSAPGLRFGSWVPQIAKQAHHLSVIRSLTLNAEDDNHELGHAKLLSAINQRPPGAGFYESRKDWPSMGAVTTAVKPSASGLPTSVTLPIRMTLGPGGQAFCGQTAGFLGSRYDPWVVTEDPASPKYHVPDLMPLPGMSVERLGNRRRLLNQVDELRRDLDGDLGIRQLGDVQQKAFMVTTSAQTRDAFDLAKETEKQRDRYGRHTFGQSLLLGRRLAEAGVHFVQVNLGSMNSWDSHSEEDKNLKQLTPPFDQGFSALIEDLNERGMLDETLVLCLSEMGRNPVLGKTVTGAAVNAATMNGRNHWQWCWSCLVAGAGVRGGTAVGQSDEWAGNPDGEGYYPADLGATVYAALGIDPRTEVHDLEGRPLAINDGEVISKLF